VKIIAKPIQMVSWTNEKGDINPIRFKLKNEDESSSVIKVDRVLFKDKEKLAGNPMLIYRCQSVIRGTERIFELKYELGTCKWTLWKI
jgi:hypothetical protein